MPSEPDRYDLDQMMDRLKRRSSDDSTEEGELVTRADGSQAVRVKRRKRRSTQPYKERQRRIRMLQVSAVLVLVLLALLLVGFMTIYVNTAPFRKQVVKQVGIASGAEVELQQFRMNPTGANASGADLNWPEGNVLESLSLRLLRADVSMWSSLGGGLRGEELDAQTARLDLRLPVAGEPRRLTPRAEGELPVYFKQWDIKQLQIHIHGRQPSVFRLIDSEAVFQPGNGEEMPVLSLAGGDLRAMGWPLLRLNRAYMEFDGAQANVVGMSLMHADEERGLLELSGVISSSANEPCTLQVEAESFPISGLVGDALGKLVTGRVNTEPMTGENILHLNPGEPSAANLTMDFHLNPNEDFSVQFLPCLYALSQTLGDEWFSRPTFSDMVSGRIVRDAERVEIRDLDCTSHGRMAIRGDLSHEAGRLGGKLRIGIAPGMLQTAENVVLNRMFGSPSGGFCWLEVELSGATAAPEDNFSELYDMASKVGAQQGGKPGETERAGKAESGSTFDFLTRPR